MGPWAARHVGLPVRREIARLPRAESRIALGLDPNQKVLAVLGGSQGATALNDWARAHAGVLAAEGVQVYCLTGLGKGPAESVQMRTKTGAAVRLVFAPFCDRMAELLRPPTWSSPGPVRGPWQSWSAARPPQSSYPIRMPPITTSTETRSFSSGREAALSSTSR